MATEVIYRYVCDFCGGPIKEEDRWEVGSKWVVPVPFVPDKIERRDACSACIEVALKAVEAQFNPKMVAA